MGRGLKIAKATLLTMTGTSSSTNLVTVSQNLNTLNIIQNMMFTPNVTRGGLTAGTTYWILKVYSSSTFSVSATELSQNVDSTPVSLSNSSTPTILTVGAVDTGFQNPDTAQQSGNTSTNPGASYGVVGGNTGIYGTQVLANVNIGVTGTGNVYANTSSNIVVGNGTDFANVANGTQLYALYGVPGTYDPHLLGTVANNVGNVSVAIANCAANGIIRTSGNAELFVSGGPVTFDTSFGGLTAGVTYFVNSIANASAFNVATMPGGAVQTLSANNSVTANALQQQAVLAADSANNAAGYTGYGDPLLQALPEPGFIVRQKGKQKYLVQGTTTGLVAQCLTANVANSALTPNTMTITATYANSSTAYVESLSNYNLEIFGNTAPVLQNAYPAIATFGTAYDANTYPGTNPITGQTSNVSGQPYPIVTIDNA
jgi:hypothetical protein